MPSGAKPGERRGGRAKGTPNKSTAERQDALQSALKVALERIGPEAIEALSPAQYMRLAMHEAAKAGLGREAWVIARDAAPYFDQKLAPIGGDGGDGDQTTVVVIRGGFPPKVRADTAAAPNEADTNVEPDQPPPGD